MTSVRSVWFRKTYPIFTTVVAASRSVFLLKRMTSLWDLQDAVDQKSDVEQNVENDLRQLEPQGHILTCTMLRPLNASKTKKQEKILLVRLYLIGIELTRQGQRWRDTLGWFSAVESGTGYSPYVSSAKPPKYLYFCKDGNDQSTDHQRLAKYYSSVEFISHLTKSEVSLLLRSRYCLLGIRVHRSRVLCPTTKKSREPHGWHCRQSNANRGLSQALLSCIKSLLNPARGLRASDRIRKMDVRQCVKC
jgi:hypothetical protein